MDNNDLISKHQALIDNSLNRYGYDSWKDELFRNAVQPPKPPKFSETRLRSMLDSRMGWDAGERCPFKSVLAVKISDEQAAVFVAFSGDAVVLKDDLNLFPSDTLITQLRLIGGSK